MRLYAWGSPLKLVYIVTTICRFNNALAAAQVVSRGGDIYIAPADERAPGPFAVDEAPESFAVDEAPGSAADTGTRGGEVCAVHATRSIFAPR